MGKPLMMTLWLILCKSKKMGNEITTIAPSQLQPIENYFTGDERFTEIHSLSSTRFFKTVRCTHRGGGEAVVKVLVKYDLSVQYSKTYRPILLDLKAKLASVPNALAYADFWETDKAAYLLRQHVRHSLYDLLSVRPALSTVEKKWIAFQLLRALKDSHVMKCFHGDIKSENVLVTGWNWVFLSDYAPFKPTELPMDDPGDYDFYFDTARRRTCYIAPERFIDPTERSPDPQAKLTESMDLFSLGCVIAEMFSDGRQVFDLSRLLEYRRQQLRPLLKWIKNEGIKELVQNMIQKSAEEQYSAEEILLIHSGTVFPDYFESFLHGYMQAVTYGDENGPIRPDPLIEKLHSNLETILVNVAFSQSEDLGDRESGYGDGLVMVLSAVTSHMQVLQYSSSKIKALHMLKAISRHIRDELILDRVVPYLMHCVGDPMATVKVEAVRTLTHCLGMIRKLVKSDVNLFQDYILPGLATIPDDPNVSVRLALADCIADLAESAHRFLEIALHDASQAVDEDYLTLGSYDSELSLLRSQVAQRVASFLSDPDNTVKKMVMKHLKKLCLFFGFQQANDVILGHMITYLNDKGDWQLHKCFFECIVDVVAYLGWPAVCLVEPLLLQGLKDPEETVISKAVDAITGMCSLKLFDMPKLLEFVDHVLPLLFHPNIWIRYSAVGFVCGMAREMGDIDTACFLSPRLEGYLRQPVMDLTNHYLLLSSLKEPLLRPIYDYVLKQDNLQSFFDCLIERRSTRELSRPGYDVKYPPISARFEPRFRRLHSMGLDSYHEDKLIELQQVILSVRAGRLYSSDVPASNGMYDLSTLSVTGNSVSFDTVDEQWFKEPSDAPAIPKETRSQVPFEQRQSTKSDEVEWNLMFSDDPPSKLKAAPTSTTKSSLSESPVSGSRSTSLSMRGSHPLPPVTPGMRGTQDVAAAPPLLEIEQNLPSPGDSRGIMRGRKGRHKRSKSDTSTLVQSRFYGTELSLVEGRHPRASQAESTCHNVLEALIQHKIQQHKSGQAFLKGQQHREKAFFRAREWRTESGAGSLKLVSHLQEHKSAINRIRVSTDASATATFSSDGTFKVWNTQKLDMQPFILKSSFNYNKLAGQIKTGVFCNSSHCVAAGSSEGTIHVVSLERKDHPVLTWSGSTEGRDDGAIMEMHCLDEQGQQNTICYGTSMGRVHGMDLRVGKPVWTVQQEYRTGLLTAMATDPEQNWVATGTSCGFHTVWDIRFLLPINSWQYCDDNMIGPVYRLMPHPQHSHLLLSAVEGNNEVSAWNMETGQKKLMLWGVSQAPPFSRSSKECRNTSVRAVCCGFVDSDLVVLTGGTDRQVRMWNLRQPDLSTCVLAPSGVRRGDLQYKYQMIEGVEVIAEVDRGSTGAPHTEDPPGVPHMDIITDLAVAVRGLHPFLLSASYNGELKIWR